MTIGSSFAFNRRNQSSIDPANGGFGVWSRQSGDGGEFSWLSRRSIRLASSIWHFAEGRDIDRSRAHSRPDRLGGPAAAARIGRTRAIAAALHSALGFEPFRRPDQRRGPWGNHPRPRRRHSQTPNRDGVTPLHGRRARIHRDRTI